MKVVLKVKSNGRCQIPIEVRKNLKISEGSDLVVDILEIVNKESINHISEKAHCVGAPA